MPTTVTKGRQINDNINNNLFMCTKSDARNTQFVLTTPSIGAWNFFYNGGTGRKSIGQHKLLIGIHLGRHHSNNGPHKRHLIQSTKVHTMVQSVMTMLSKDM
jgi:hypothetical protein